MSHHLKKYFLKIALLVFAGGIMPSAKATTDTWQGNTSTNWNTAANWLAGSVPAASDTLVFTNAGSAGAGLNNDIAAGRVFNGVIFTNGAGAFMISGNTFGLNGTIANFSTNVQNLNANIILTNAGIINASATNILIGGNISDNGSNCNLTLNGGKGVTLSGSNSFGGTLAINSGTVLIISSTNNLGGGTNLTFGGNSSSSISTAASVKIPANDQVAVGTGSTASFTSSSSGKVFEIAAKITGAGGAKVGSSSGTVRFSNDASDYTGNFSTGYGTIEFTSVANGGSPSALGAGTGSFTIGNSLSVGTFRFIGVTNCATTRAIVWSATSGTLNLDASGGGTVAFLAGGALRSGSGNITLNLQGSNSGTNTLAQIINDGAASGTTTLAKSGLGNWVLTAANTFSAGVNLNGGNLQVVSTENSGVSGPLGNSGAINFNGGTLQFSAANTFDYSPRFSTAAGQAFSFDGNGQTVTLATALNSSNGTLTVNSALPGGKIILARTNILSGVTVLGGTLSVSNDATLGLTTNYVVLNGGTLSPATNFHYNINRTLALGTSGGTLDIPAGVTLTFDGNMYDSGGSGSLVKNGAGTLAMSTYASSPYVTYTGNTVISNGTLSVSGSGVIGASNNLVIASGATFDVTGVSSGYTLGGAQTLVAGNGTSVVKGKLTLPSTAVLALFWTNGVPSLTIYSNKLTLNNNLTTVTVAGGTPLPVGVYKIISKGTGGSVAGNVTNSLVNVAGAGALAGASLQITSSELYLNVHGSSATTTTLTTSTNVISYGNSVTLTASVSPTNATGIMTFTDSTTTYGTAALSGGQASLVLGAGALNAGVYTMSVSYNGNATYGPSVSGGLTQTVNQATVTVVANNLTRWTGNANPALTVSYIGFAAGDTAAVLSGAPNLTTTATLASPAGNYPITITAGTLADTSGNYLLSFTNGILSVTAPALPYPQGTAFPLMLYQVVDAPSAAAVAGYGWNIIQTYQQQTNSDINSYLQLAAGYSLAGSAHIPCYGDASTNFVEWPQAQVQAWIQGSMTNSNMAWWDMPEEMRSWMTTEVKLQKDYRAWVRLYDTNGPRPVYEYTPNARTATNQIAIVTNLDVIGCGAYCEAVGQPHAWVRYKIQEAGLRAVKLGGCTIGSNYLANQKTVVAVLYLADPGSITLPTPDQSYHDVWSSIASGAQGINVYSYWHGVHDNPVLTNNLNAFNLAAAQISGSEIGTVILYGTPKTNVNFIVTAGPTNTDSFLPGDGSTWQYPSLNVLCKTWSTNAYVIVVNSTSNTVSAVITNLPATNGTASLPFELRSLPVSGGTLSDTFAPWGVHIYKIAVAAAPASPPAINSIVIGGSSVVLNCTGTAYAGYILQRSTNLANATGWINVATNNASGTGFVLFTNSVSSGAAFYKLQAQ
jgi:autotransporter-associated beta strand protein